jgi:hypothetical protein
MFYVSVCKFIFWSSSVSFKKISYVLVPLVFLLNINNAQKWQKGWENCTKAAITKQFFPNLRDRVKLNINVNPNFTAIVTGHGKTRAYLHQFKIIETAACPCNKGDQTVDHLLNQCTLLKTQRELLRKNILTHWGRVTQICVYTHINNLNTRSPMC